MELYQKTVLGIAIVLLIAAYVMIFFTFVNNNSQWPPAVAKCPDYWTYDPDNDICTYDSLIYPNDSTKLADKSTCDKYKYATENSISWSGLSYGVHMDC